MKWRELNPEPWRAGLVALGLSISGCTHTLDVPTVSYAEYHEKEKINLHVELRLTEELQNAASERTQGFDKFIIPLGNHLGVNAETLSRAIFTDVSVAKETAKGGETSADAILIPRMVGSMRVSPISNFVKQALKIVVVLEWTMKDPDANVIWIDTITAEGNVSEPSYSPEDNRKKLIEALMRDLFPKSHKSIFSSQEIRTFAATRTAKSKED